MSGEYKLGSRLSLTDLISGPFKKITGNADELKSKLEEIDGGVKKFENSSKSLKIGGGMLAAGTGMAMFTMNMIDANRETSVLKSGLKSLNLGDDAISKISESAANASSSMSVIRNEFLDAAYDIKSGIETIDNSSIGTFTEIVAKAATATKGNTKQFAGLFGTIYNQNKKLYSNLSDEDFGKKIGNSLSFAVQMYKTDGGKMQQAIESVSGAASVAGYDMAEQFNVLGILQNVMQSGEAGTGFKAFVSKAAEAGKKLGMSFVDAKGKLLPTVGILDKLKLKYGDTIEASEAADMKKAFGSDEAMKLINNLWDKTGKLKTNIDALRNAKGTKLMDSMAAANIDNIDTQLKTLGNTWNNLKSTLGGGMGAAVGPFIDLLKGGIKWLNEIAMKHPTLTKWVGGTIALGSVALIAGGGIMMLKGAAGLYALSQMVAGGATKQSTLALIKNKVATLASAGASRIAAGAQWIWSTAIKAGGLAKATAVLSAHKVATLASAGVSKIAAAAQWVLNTSLWGCPLVWIIAGIVALGVAIYGIVKYWDLIAEKAGAAWDWIKGCWSGTGEWLSGLWGSVISSMDGFFSNIWSYVKNAGSRILSTLWEGIASKASWLKNNVKNVFGFIGNLFPQSDAKEGPFSKLTYSGKSLIRTFNTGIQQESKKTPAVAPYMKKTMDAMTGDEIPGTTGAGHKSSAGVILNIKNLIGELNLSGGSTTDNLDNLSSKIAEAIMNEVLRYENA